jgi:hypothetical protein
MAAPEYVPLQLEDLPRRTERIPGHGGWTASRPGDLNGPQPLGPKFGRPGPDQGYALTLAGGFEERLRLKEHEKAADAIAGCVAVSLKRASLFGRAPVIYDLELAFALWGFLGEAPDDLVSFRRPLFEAASHHYWDQRQIVDLVPDDTLRLTPAQVRERQPDWRTLIDVR